MCEQKNKESLGLRGATQDTTDTQEEKAASTIAVEDWAPGAIGITKKFLGGWPLKGVVPLKASLTRWPLSPPPK